MLYYTTGLLLAALVLLFVQPRHEENRWASFFLLCGAIGGLTDVIGGLIPKSQWMLVMLNHTLTPYGVLVFCIVYTKRPSSSRIRRNLKAVLLLPVLMMWVQVCMNMQYQIDYRLLLLWTAPYYLISCILLLLAWHRETHPVRKRSRLITAVLMIPTLLAVLFFINVGNAISPGYDFFPYISGFMIYSLAAAVLSAFVYGVLGIKFRIERESLEHTLQAISTSTSMLNHSIKNELGKIGLSTENIKLHLQKDDALVLQQLQIIENSSEHLLGMVASMNDRLRDFNLEKLELRLDLLLQEMLKRHQMLFKQHHITLQTRIVECPVMKLDPIHTSEAVSNILLNAVEAMPDGGGLIVNLHLKRRGVELKIKDHGVGIPEHALERVYEPFYSTKGSMNRNYGLGLSYVYSVMQKSGGSIQLSSREHVGTEVRLYFPYRS